MILHFEKLVSFALILERLSPLIEPHSKLGLRMQLGLNSPHRVPIRQCALAACRQPKGAAAVQSSARASANISGGGCCRQVSARTCT